MKRMKPSEIAKLIDYSLLKPTVSEKDIRRLCANARKYKFHAVCVNSCWVRQCKRLLRGSGVKVAATVGYPLGAASTKAKAEEARAAFEDGAEEIDAVINVGELLSGNRAAVLRDLKSVAREARRNKGCIKAIIETAYLSKAQKIAACKIALEAGVDFVKTSTGFAPKGAAVEDVRLIRKMVGKKAGVKAAGGIKDLRQVLALVAAGASRIGASAGPEIVEEAKRS